MDDCIFCKIIRGEIPSWKVYENENVYAFLDIHPATPYHTLVIPKRHSRDIFDIAEEDSLEVMRAIRHLSRLYREKLGITDLQIVNSSGAQAQQDVFHIHFHLVPRSSGDGQDISWSARTDLPPQFEEMLARLR